jgi:lysozyme
MKTSKKGLDLIKEFEGLRLQAYKCAAGVWTIGWGHTSAAGTPHVFPGMRITAAQAEAILIADLKQYEDAVLKAVKRDLTQGQFDACVSLCYNIGAGAFARSTVVRRINAGRMADVPAAIMMWTRAGGRELPGLVRRRRAEAALWRSLVEERGTAGRADVAQVEEGGADVAPSKSPAVVTAGGLAAAGGAAGAVAPLITGIANPWQFAGLALLILAAGVVTWLFASGRLTVNRGE